MVEHTPMHGGIDRAAHCVVANIETIPFGCGITCCVRASVVFCDFIVFNKH